MELERLIDGLDRPAAYPHAVPAVEIHQTHISVVFLAGDFAYKIKKPVELGFVDYGTLDRRRHFCREEVRLNRRLAPEVYLGVVAVVEREGGLRVAPDGPAAGEEPVEWAVRMRRLPADRTLEALLEREAVTSGEVEAVAEYLAGFHAGARRGPEISRYGRWKVVAANFRDNFRQSRGQVGSIVHPDVFRELRGLAEDALEAARPAVEARAGRDVPCDTHGDLRLDHVYLLPGRREPVIVDCIEFNPAFRYADPVADMAFLAMDLQQAGRRDLAAAFADAYFRESGKDGAEEGRDLLALYVAYRATVRGKVQGIKAGRPEVPADEREQAAATATGHWLLALGALARPVERPGLVLVGGLPATGKSTLARRLAAEAGFSVVRSDVVRKELAGLPPDAPAGAAYGRGLYSPERTEATYAACLRRVREALFEGGRVIVDASFHSEARRRAFLEAARRRGARARFLVCRVAPEEARRRLEARTTGASDADWEVYREMAGRWDPPGQATRRVTAEIPTEGTVEESVRRGLAELREAGLR